MSTLGSASATQWFTLDAESGVQKMIDAARAEEAAGTREILLSADDAATIDPFVIAGAVATATTSIRIGVHVPIDRWHPYLVARRLAALDKISHGRIAWWPDDTNATRRAEAIDIVEALLVSWAPDAVVNDRTVGLHVDTDRVTAVDVHTTYFSVHTPLDVCAGPQGVVPVIGPESDLGAMP
ncbi:LLM class flavin-dependent oxidoreductase [Gordonia sp. CPCC 206044]|uniref:LLM class flavin-dependent oxidoreductase n=1 Tax=Gordonia sp. CPCC 206044 TaxID=3140793 RepID=UPI003AF3DF6E